MPLPTIENLVFEGGGIKGLAYCGALEVLEKKGLLQNVTRYAGTSAGAMASLLMAIGYTIRELKHILHGLDYGSLASNKFGIIGGAVSIFNDFGYCNGRGIEEILKKWVKDKTGKDDYTFKELWELRHKELVVVGCNITKMKEVHFSKDKTPNMSIIQAVRISMSVPGVYEPVVMDGEYYVDGGLVNNYPLWVFGDTKKTLGLKLLTEHENEGHDIYTGSQEIDSIFKFMMACVNTISMVVERNKIKQGTGYWDRTIEIYTETISTLDFNLNKDQRDFLVRRGREAAFKYISDLQVDSA